MHVSSKVCLFDPLGVPLQADIMHAWQWQLKHFNWENHVSKSSHQTSLNGCYMVVPFQPIVAGWWRKIWSSMALGRAARAARRISVGLLAGPGEQRLPKSKDQRENPRSASPKVSRAHLPRRGKCPERPIKHPRRSPLLLSLQSQPRRGLERPRPSTHPWWILLGNIMQFVLALMQSTTQLSFGLDPSFLGAFSL